MAVPPPSASEPGEALIAIDGLTCARFRSDVLGVFPEAADGAMLGLAVSGGPDSMALLALGHAAFAGQVRAVTVDHALRESSAGEAVMVADACATMGVPHDTLVPGTPIAGASIQAQAREARYLLMEKWAGVSGVAAILTAHHADDQAETFLMRAARAAGLSGLAAIRPRQAMGEIALLRPLLDWRRAELRAIVRRAELPFVDDPSNSDERHDRTRFRRLLEDNAWLDAPRIARAAAHLAEADTAIREMRDLLRESRHRPAPAGEVRFDARDLPRELRRRLARDAIGLVREANAITVPLWSDARAIEPLLDALESRRRATMAGVLASSDGSVWRFRAAPPRRSH